MRKRLFSMLCTMALLCYILPLQAFATITTSAAIAQNKEILEAYNIPTQMISNSFTDDGNTCFVLDYGNNIVETLTILPSTDGTASLRVESADLTNELTLTKDGKLYVDGGEVTYNILSAHESSTFSELSSVKGTAPHNRSYQYSFEPPFGSNPELDYTAFALNQEANVVLAAALCTLTVTVLTSVIGLFFSWTGAAISVAIAIHEVAQAYNLMSYGLSYSEIVSTLNDPPIVGRVYEYYTTWYTQKDFKGAATTEVYYETFEYY